MNTRLVLDDCMRVGAFVAPLIGYRGPWFEISAIGLERDEELVAGVVYEDYTGKAVQAHIAGKPGRKWMTPRFLWAIFYYPFKQLGVDRIYCFVSSSNAESMRLAEHLGFKVHSVLEGAARDGNDMIIYSLHRDECRFLELYHVEQ